jgi:hypothetical protein
MQSRGVTDLPYWPSQNTYVYKEVWMHSASRWLWLTADLIGQPSSAPHRGTIPALELTSATAPNGDVTIRLTARGTGEHTFALRAANLTVSRPTRTVRLRAGRTATVEWRARPTSSASPWVAVVVPDGELSQSREVFGSMH